MCGGNLKASACSRRARVFVTPCGETLASNWAAQSRQRRTREYAQEPKPETHEYINEDGRRVTQIAGLRGNHSLDPVGSVAGVAGGYPPSNSFSPPSLRMARTATVALVGDVDSYLLRARDGASPWSASAPTSREIENDLSGLDHLSPFKIVDVRYRECSSAFVTAV